MKVSASNAAAYYFQQDPLFSKEGEFGVNAVWIGRGTAVLGLNGPVNQEVFHNLLYGLDPSGENRLVGRENGEQSHHKNAATDVLLAIPKSFSVAALFDVSLRESALQAAIKTAEYIESNHTFARQTHGGVTEQVTAKMIASLFMHSTSRADDVHIHGHLVVLNMGVRPDGSFSCLENRSIFQNQSAITQTFYSHLSDEVKAIGYGIEIHLGLSGQKIPELAGYQQEINAVFSKRHELITSADQISTDLEKRLPRLPEKANEALVQLYTKSDKNPNLSETEMVNRHTQQLRSIGITPAEYLSHLKMAGQEIQANESLTAHEQHHASPNLMVMIEQGMSAQKEASLSVQDHTGGDGQKLPVGSTALETIYSERLEELKSEASSMNDWLSKELKHRVSLENEQNHELQHQQNTELTI